MPSQEKARDEARCREFELQEAYLDYAAATPMAPQVVEAMVPFWSERFYNPSAPYEKARIVRADLEDAKTRIAHVLGTRASNITLTAGATEANNLAFAAVDGGVLCDAIEHESVLACAQERGGTIVAVESDGTVTASAVRNALDPTTELVSIELANGEVGTIQPVREIARIVREERLRRLEEGNRRPLLLHTDVSQAAGYLSINASTLGVDLMTLSAAKIYGPKQVGALWHADGVALRPLVRGGGQEGGIRSGTENVAGAMGFACALELAERLRKQEVKRLAKLSDRLRKGLAQAVPGVVFSGPSRAKDRLPGLVHASFPGVEARRLVIALERRGVSVGTGSACAASHMRVSHVLTAMGVAKEVAMGSLRITLGRPTTKEEIDYALLCIVECVEQERARRR